MTDLSTTLHELDEHLTTAIAADPLQALRDLATVQRDVDSHQRKAVRAAAPRHSWTEIGEALGVSKQAAHQKFADELKREIKAEAKTFKTAMKKLELREAADAKDKLDAAIDEFKQAAGRRRQADRGR
jgi:hypothetical protein